MKKRLSDLTQSKIVTYLRLLYPVWMITGMFSLLYVPSQLIVAGNPGATAGNIATHELLFRAGIVGSLLTQLIFIFAVLLLYKLFETVNKNQAGLMVVFALVGVPIAMLNTLNQVAALLVLETPGQMQFFLNLNHYGIVVASLFWGLWLFPLGFLVYKSGYFPKIIGVALFLGGIGYIASSFTKLLFPELNSLAVVFETLTMGEVIFCLWLVMIGAKLSKRGSK